MIVTSTVCVVLLKFVKLYAMSPVGVAAQSQPFGCGARTQVSPVAAFNTRSQMHWLFCELNSGTSGGRVSSASRAPDVLYSRKRHGTVVATIISTKVFASETVP